MQQRHYYDRAMFWVALGAGAATVGGILVSAGVPLVGWPLVLVGGLMFLWALRFYLRHDRPDRAGARFEVVTTDWECEPPLSHSPVHDPRECVAHVVLRNQGAEGNGVLIVHYVGLGRAGNEYPEMKRQTVIPTTAAGAFVEIRCSVGSVPPLKLERYPKVEVIPAATKPTAKPEPALAPPSQPITHIARPWAQGKAAEEAAERPQTLVVLRADDHVVLANTGSRPARNCIYFSMSDNQPGWKRSDNFDLGSRAGLVKVHVDDAHLPVLAWLFGDTNGPDHEVVLCEDDRGYVYRFRVPSEVPDVWTPGDAEPDWLKIYRDEWRRKPLS
jgi:hypothetical protein